MYPNVNLIGYKKKNCMQLRTNADWGPILAVDWNSTPYCITIEIRGVAEMGRGTGKSSLLITANPIIPTCIAGI